MADKRLWDLNGHVCLVYDGMFFISLSIVDTIQMPVDQMSVLEARDYGPDYLKLTDIHRYGAGGNMYAYHAAGPSSIPGRTSFLGEVFSGFFLSC